MLESNYVGASVQSQSHFIGLCTFCQIVYVDSEVPHEF